MKAFLVVVVVACQQSQPPPPTPAPAPPPACELDGAYRVRFSTNGAAGWWLYGTFANGAMKLTGGALEMVGLTPGPIATKVDLAACTITLTAKSDRAGDMTFVLARAHASDNHITGTFSRTLGGNPLKSPAETLPLAGLREVSPPKLPACIHPGVYVLATDPKTKWKLSSGEPRGGLSCAMDSLMPRARIRISMLDNEIIVDKVDDQNAQLFERGVVKREGDCAVTLAFEIQDLRFTGAHLTFAGDQLTGTVDDMTWDFFENGNLGENLWKCSATHTGMSGTRVAD